MEELAAVLPSVADAIELSALRVADGLRDIAKAMNGHSASTHPLRDRIAGLVEDHGDVVKLGAHRIREAT